MIGKSALPILLLQVAKLPGQLLQRFFRGEYALWFR